MSSDVIITVDSSDLDSKMLQLRTKLPEIPGVILEDSSAIIMEGMREIVSVKTGKLRNSIGRIVNPGSARVFTSSGYGLFVDEDTKPHVIRPRNGLFLAWETDGIMHFAREVHHPGTKGQHFTTKTLENKRGEIVERVRRIMQDLFSGLIGANR